MKRIKHALNLTLLLLFVAFTSCKKGVKANDDGKFPIDSTKFADFFQKHPEFKEYQKEVTALYRKQNFQYVWYDEDGRNDFAEMLYSKASRIDTEGVPVPLPYRNELADLFDDDKSKPDLKNELLISSMYFFYAKKVFAGIDPSQSKKMGWYLPRQKTSYVDYLDALLKDGDLIKKDEDANIAMYYNLRKGLEKYRELKEKGGWQKIVLPANTKSLKIGDDLPAVAQLRKRLFISGELSSDSGNSKFDDTLKKAVESYQQKHGTKPDGVVGPVVLEELNIPVEERIKTIVVNMERCRWLSPDIADAKEYIGVNIPSYRMRYVRDGKIALESDVVVGKEANKTVVFSGMMSYLVFSPYWNIPKSIIAKEIKPGMDADKDYLEKHNMEWNDGNIRQKPGKDNSLGLVKFMFPNSNNIYLHDTPAKSLFSKEDRALSHGCVRVQKARELAELILKDDKNWNADKIDTAMNAGKEQSYSLKRKIPVYIAYFTATADENGKVNFYNDVYKKDDRLAKMLYN